MIILFQPSVTITSYFHSDLYPNADETYLAFFSVLKRLWSALAKLTEDMSNLNVSQKSNHPYILAIIRFSLSKPLATRPYAPNVKIQPENLHPFQGFSHLGEVVLMAYLAP